MVNRQVVHGRVGVVGGWRQGCRDAAAAHQRADAIRAGHSGTSNFTTATAASRGPSAADAGWRVDFICLQTVIT